MPANNDTLLCVPGNLTSCYFYLTTAASWDSQRTNCQAMGGDLVTFDSLWEQVTAPLAPLLQAWCQLLLPSNVTCQAADVVDVP